MGKIEFAEELKSRTKKFAIDIIQLCKSFPRSQESYIISKQLIRSATSVASNYRAVCRARSSAEFYSKICIVVEEADESLFWLEIVQDTDILNNEKTKQLTKEASEILSIVASSKRTAGRSKLTGNTIQQFSKSTIQ